MPLWSPSVRPPHVCSVCRVALLRERPRVSLHQRVRAARVAIVAPGAESRRRRFTTFLFLLYIIYLGSSSGNVYVWFTQAKKGSAWPPC
jgi:hypothetical protein